MPNKLFQVQIKVVEHRTFQVVAPTLEDAEFEVLQAEGPDVGIFDSDVVDVTILDSFEVW